MANIFYKYATYCEKSHREVTVKWVKLYTPVICLRCCSMTKHNDGDVRETEAQNGFAAVAVTNVDGQSLGYVEGKSSYHEV